MYLTELIEHFCDKDVRDNCTAFLEKNAHKPQEDVAFFACCFEKVNQAQAPFTAEDLAAFKTRWSVLNTHTKALLVYILINYVFANYKHYARETTRIADIERQIESDLKDKKPITQSACDPRMFHSLFNGWQLLHTVESTGYSNASGLRIKSEAREGYHMLPLAINAMRLTGIMPGDHPFAESDPLYPAFVKRHPLIQPMPGIQSSRNLTPFRRQKKLVTGKTTDSTLLASDGNKLCYILRSQDASYSPAGILASKIATLISNKHFSSERLLDNQLTASRALQGYVTPMIIYFNPRASIFEDLIKNAQVIPGSGIIDEVCNFVQEPDCNAENLGYSSEQGLADRTGFLTKIDFDRCWFSPIQSTEYKRNAIATWIYTKSSILGDPDYHREQLRTRLKLALIPPILFEELSQKAWADEQRFIAIDTNECISRQKMALDFFLMDESCGAFINSYPQVAHECVDEIRTYICSHRFRGGVGDLLDALAARAAEVMALLPKPENTDTTSLSPAAPVPQEDCAIDIEIHTIAAVLPEPDHTDSTSIYSARHHYQDRKRIYHAIHVGLNIAEREAFEAAGYDFNALRHLQGDTLKKAVLDQLRDKLTTDKPDDPAEWARKLTDKEDTPDPGIAVLRRAQGLVTAFFAGKQTDSFHAFLDMVHDYSSNAGARFSCISD